MLRWEAGFLSCPRAWPFEGSGWRNRGARVSCPLLQPLCLSPVSLYPVSLFPFPVSLFPFPVSLLPFPVPPFLSVTLAIFPRFSVLCHLPFFSSSYLVLRPLPPLRASLSPTFCLFGVLFFRPIRSCHFFTPSHLPLRPPALESHILFLWSISSFPPASSPRISCHLIFLQL